GDHPLVFRAVPARARVFRRADRRGDDGDVDRRRARRHLLGLARRPARRSDARAEGDDAGRVRLGGGAAVRGHADSGGAGGDRARPSALVGLAMWVAVAAEVGALLAFPALLKRFSLRALFSIAFIGSIARWALVSRAQGAAALVALQLLHGLTFGVWWGCAIE